VSFSFEHKPPSFGSWPCPFRAAPHRPLIAHPIWGPTTWLFDGGAMSVLRSLLDQRASATLPSLREGLCSTTQVSD
jgi:hypothetical protein